MKGWNASALLVLFTTSCTPKPVTQQDGSLKTTYVHQYGVEVADREEWEERGASGQIIRQHKTGQEENSNWKDGQLHGLTTKTFPHSTIIHKEVYYDKGAKVWQTVHYESGMPKRQDIFRPGNITLVSTWYEDGTPRSAEEYHANNLWSGEYFTPVQELESQVVEGSGERIRRDGHGQLIAKDDFENGKKVLEVVYFTNGMPQKYIPYVNDQIEGTLKTFYAGGEPATVESWKNNKQNGDTYIYRSGERVSIIPYVNGEKEGVETGFRPGTEVISEQITWKNGQKHGPSIYFVDGNKVEEYFFNGQKVSKMEYVHRESNSRSIY